ncbi:MAG: sulfurtransferase-like selenium metabolism protein YedF [Candidatus Melainabacteria bacterium]|nr:sulfurtransferase-like selenium metabolism protein YedF [Candidatus Melainabacteria bacterium]
MKKSLDLRGLTCPEPVLRTKKLIDDQSLSRIEILVDSEVNVQNLTRLGNSQKLSVQSQAKGEHFEVVLQRAATIAKDEHAAHSHEADNKQRQPSHMVAGGNQNLSSTGTIILISRNTFGSTSGESDRNSDKVKEDQDFSSNLLNLFLQTLLQSGHEPRAILMVNSGVQLMDPDGPYIKVLTELREKGIEVLACGLCLDYYGLKSKVQIEQVTNMFAICEYLFSADRIISP